MLGLDINIRLLREFVALAKCLNFNKAAKELFISQPVLSKHISYLEKLLGVQLFLRNKHVVQLTATGEIFFQEAEAIIAKYEEAILKVKHTSEGLIGRIKIGFLERAVRKFLTDLLIYFNKHYPQIETELFSFDLEPLKQALLEEKIDIGFTLSLGLDNLKAPLVVKKLYTDSLCAVMRSDHPLAKRKTIKLSDLKNETIIMPSPTNYSTAITQAEQLFIKNQGNIPRITKYHANVDTIMIMAELGKGIAIMPQHHKIYATPNIRFVRIEDDECSVDVVIAWSTTNLNPALQHFLKIVDSTLQSSNNASRNIGYIQIRRLAFPSYHKVISAS